MNYVIGNDAGRNTALDGYANLPMWVCWQNEERDGKSTKVPWSPTSNGHASSIDPSTWSTRAIAEGSARANGRTGIGIEFVPLDEDRHLGGIDLDACIDDEGNVTPWGREVIELVASYTEISPSGRGLKIIFEHDHRVTLAEGVRWRSAVRQPSLIGGKDRGIEFYLSRRYFTVTDNVFENYAAVRTIGIDVLRDVQCLMEAFGDKPKASTHHPRHRDDDQKRLFDALASIPGEDTYAEWVRVGMALHAEEQGSAEAYRAFVAWSAKSSKFKALECERKWREWGRSPARNLTGGTIIYLARRNGWQDPRQAKTNGAAKSPADVEAAKEIEWAEPEPLISDAEPPPPYPIEALPDLMRHAVEEVQRFAQTPVEIVAASAMSALSISAQHLVDVRRTSALQGPTALYYLIIADSGDRKTTLDRYFMTPIYEYERQEREKGKATEANHAAEMAVWEAKKQAATDKLEKAAKGDKALEEHQAGLAQLEKGKPTPPRIPRLIYADATQEKLLRNLATGWPSAGIVSSEGGAVFGAHAMGRDTVMRTLGALNVLWDGGTLQVDRVSGGSFVVRGARLSINLQVQALVLRDFMDGTRGLARGSGFLARFLLAAPETRQGTRMFREAPASWPALTKFNARIGALLATKATTNDDGTLSPTVLDFSDEAKATWIACHDKIEKAIGPTGEFVDVRDVAAKAADNIARMAALFHILDERNGYQKIGPAAVRSAATVVVWHLLEAKRFLGPLAASPEDARAAALDSWLRKHCRRESVTSVSTRTTQQFGPIRGRKALDEALDILGEAGRVRVVADGKKRLVAINPALLETTP